MLDEYLNKVFLTDVMDLLKKLSDESVDVVFGDPDYNVGVKYRDKTYLKSFDEYIEWYVELAKEPLRILKDIGNLFFYQLPETECIPPGKVSGRRVLRRPRVRLGVQLQRRPFSEEVYHCSRKNSLS